MVVERAVKVGVSCEQSHTKRYRVHLALHKMLGLTILHISVLYVVAESILTSPEALPLALNFIASGECVTAVISIHPMKRQRSMKRAASVRLLMQATRGLQIRVHDHDEVRICRITVGLRLSIRSLLWNSLTAGLTEWSMREHRRCLRGFTTGADCKR